MKYSEAIRRAIQDSMRSNPRMLILGQGVWSPFYVGQTMDGIENEFGRERVLDTPVSENAVTGIALGAALTGSPTLVIHPRMDFMILAMDPIVNAAAKWRYALDWKGTIPLTVRAIINRGGEQGAQHSQSLQSWFAHIPGLRVVMPSSPKDAYFLMRSCLESPDPCIYIEDRWNYGIDEEFDANEPIPKLSEISPEVIIQGENLTLVSLGFGVHQSTSAAQELKELGINVEVIDLKILNPMNFDVIFKSVKKTGSLVVVDASWQNCSVGSEIVASVVTNCLEYLKTPPIRMSLPAAPAPTSPALEKLYYFSIQDICKTIIGALQKESNSRKEKDEN
jgi:pyruvate/2-oxoglutarate/acetoin dehydrogenase E1 component